MNPKLAPNIPFYQLSSEKRDLIVSACRNELENINKYIDDTAKNIAAISQQTPLNIFQLQNLMAEHEKLETAQQSFHFAYSNNDELNSLSDSEFVYSLRENALTMMHYMMETTSASPRHRGQKQVYIFICELLEEHLSESLFNKLERDEEFVCEIDIDPLSTRNEYILLAQHKKVKTELEALNNRLQDMFKSRFNWANENKDINEINRLLNILPECPYRMKEAARAALLDINP